MDEDLRRYLEGMEARLLGRINGASERMLNRLGSLERDFATT